MELKTIAMSIYAIGMLAWIIIWALSKGFQLMRKIPLLLVPFLLVFLVFGIDMVSISPSLDHINFTTEEQLLQVLEGNTSQILVAVFGLIILAATLKEFHGRTVISREFILYATLCMVFAVGGVLTVFWFPTHSVKPYYLLRHAKSVMYTYSISYFLAGLIAVLDNIRHRGTKHQQDI